MRSGDAHPPVDANDLALFQLLPDVLALQRLAGQDEVIDEPGARRRLALSRQAGAARSVRTARLVARPIEFFATPGGDHGVAVGDHQGQARALLRANVRDGSHPLDGGPKRGRHVVDGAAPRERAALGEHGQEDQEHDLAVRIAEHEAPELGQYLLDELGAMPRELRDVAVVGEDPAPVLKGMAVEHSLVALGRPPDVGEHRLAGHHTAQSMEELISERELGALGDVGRAIDVEGHAPTVGVLVALFAEGVLRVEQRAVDLARDDAAEAEQATHLRSTTACHRPAARAEFPEWRRECAGA